MPPQTQPLIQANHLTYLGSFTLPTTDGSGRPSPQGHLTYGGVAGMGADGQSLYYLGHSQSTFLTRISIPALGGVATVLQPAVYLPMTEQMDPVGSDQVKIGAALVANGRVIVNGYTYYDNNPVALYTLFTLNPDLSNRQGPYKFTHQGGITGQYLGVIPPEWRELLGGAAAAGASALPVISRSSSGPAFHVFDPDAVGPTTAPSVQLLGYQIPHNTLVDYNNADHYGGFAFPDGWGSVLFIRRHGDVMTYGTGTGNPALVGTPDSSGNPYVYDPTDSSKGNHAYPYRHEILAYSANELAEVKAGTKLPWEVFPYATWTLNEMIGVTGGAGTARMKSSAYDPATRRWYVSSFSGSGAPRVHVYEIAAPVETIPDIDCGGAWGEWTPTSDWGPCVKVDGVWQQTRAESREFFVDTEPSGNGQVCPVSPESRDVTQPCTPPPITLTVEVISPPAVDGTAQFAIVKADKPETPLPVGTTWTVDVPQE